MGMDKRLVSYALGIWLAALALGAAAQAPAGVDEEEAFQRAAQQYAGQPKPPLTPEVRRLKVHAETAVKVRELPEALRLYAEALQLAPWWAEGYHDRAIVLAELGRFGEAIRDMQRFLRLEPAAANAAAAQDRIYQWEFLGKRASTEDSDWQAIADSGGAEQLKGFLQKYPGGRYATLAQAKLAVLERRRAFVGTWRERHQGRRSLGESDDVFVIQLVGDTLEVRDGRGRPNISDVRIEGDVLSFIQSKTLRYQVTVSGPNQLSARFFSRGRWVPATWIRE